ncbi:BspA family leucine-rich repeat surface protein, partial [Campylobacter jejuni]|nr:BspA family leucine-rich repeat surface protein [Campylobacter jejuni]
DMSYMFCGDINVMQCLNGSSGIWPGALGIPRLISDQLLNILNVSSVTNFNQPLNNWDVSSVTNMSGMFCGSKNFDQPLNNWDVSSVTNMSGMFCGAKNFNQPLPFWDVSNVTDMSYMFFASAQSPLPSWKE